MAILTQMAREDVAKNSTGKDSLRQDLSNASHLWRQFPQHHSKYPANHELSETDTRVDDQPRYNIAMQTLTPYAEPNHDDVIYIDGVPTIPKSALAALMGNQPAMRLLTE